MNRPNTRPNTARPPRRPALWAALALLAGTPAHAIVSTTDASHWTVSSLSDTDLLDGVGQLIINGSTGCSGTLLDGGAYVLTAAHCVTTSTGVLSASRISLSFDSGAVSAAVSSASQISVYSGWTGSAGASNDLALLKLDSPVTAVSGYQIYTDDPLGQTVLLAGYGLTGTGSTGATANTFGTLHWGENVYDALYGNSTGAYLFDFDNGLGRQNLLGSTGLGSTEAMIASGDSGGASFILVDGELVLAGVHSFGASTQADIDRLRGQNFGTTNSSYGEIGGDSVLYSSATLAWLSQVTGLDMAVASGAGAAVATIPEPASWALWLVGAAGLGLRRRRSATAPRPTIA